MLKFLFRGRKEPEVKIESQRETFERLVDELNAAIDALPDKPRVTIDPATGHIMPETPEQFPDEALALPGPETSDADKTAGSGDGGEHVEPSKGEGPGKEATGETEREGPAAKVLPGTPLPNPPKPTAAPAASGR